MLGDEITTDLRAIRAAARHAAQTSGQPVTRTLQSARGSNYGRHHRHPNGNVDISQVVGVDTDLRVKPFFHHGETFSIREFAAGALNAEMGLEPPDADLLAASAGGRVVTPAGMVLDGALDTILPPAAVPGQDNDGDGHVDEIDTAVVDYLEFYLLNYFKPALGRQTDRDRAGLPEDGADRLHDLPHPEPDRPARSPGGRRGDGSRPDRGIFNDLFATATPLLTAQDDGSGHPPSHGSETPAVRRAQPVRGHEASRPRTQLLGAELQRHDPEALHDRAAVGSGLHRPLRSRRPEHDAPRRDPPPRWRGPDARGTGLPRCTTWKRSSSWPRFRPWCSSRPTTRRPT